MARHMIYSIAGNDNSWTLHLTLDSTFDQSTLLKGTAEFVEEELYLVTIEYNDQDDNTCIPTEDNIVIYRWKTKTSTFHMVQKLSVMCARDAVITQVGNDWFLLIPAASPDYPSVHDQLRIYKKQGTVFGFHSEKDFISPRKVPSFKAGIHHYSLVVQKWGANSETLDLESEAILLRWV